VDIALIVAEVPKGAGWIMGARVEARSTLLGKSMRGVARVTPVCTEKLDPHVVVMKPSKDWA
jgi:hypothetical protein